MSTDKYTVLEEQSLGPLLSGVWLHSVPLSNRLGQKGIVKLSLDGPGRLPLLDFLTQHGMTHCNTKAAIDGYDILSISQSNAVGSLRNRTYSLSLAEFLNNLLKPAIPQELTASLENLNPDWDGCQRWDQPKVNPLFRFIRYPAKTGVLVAHYDAPYIENEERRTFYSVLLYLTEGATRFIKDPLGHEHLASKDYLDWARPAYPEEVEEIITCSAGDVLLFPHRLLHDSQPNQTEKLVIRTDLSYQRLQR